MLVATVESVPSVAPVADEKVDCVFELSVALAKSLEGSCLSTAGDMISGHPDCGLAPPVMGCGARFARWLTCSFGGWIRS